MISAVGGPTDVLVVHVWGRSGQKPKSLYSADKGVDFRVPVMVWQALISSTSILAVWADLSHNTVRTQLLNSTAPEQTA